MGNSNTLFGIESSMCPHCWNVHDISSILRALQSTFAQVRNMFIDCMVTCQTIKGLLVIISRQHLEKVQGGNGSIETFTWWIQNPFLE